MSEIGDKTFFIAAILAMTNNKVFVFISALAALYLMTVLSALLGWVVTTFIPREVEDDINFMLLTTHLRSHTTPAPPSCSCSG